MRFKTIVIPLVVMSFLSLFLASCSLNAATAAKNTAQARDADHAQKMILDYLRAQIPDLAETVTLEVEERNVESLWDELQVQVFSVRGGIFEGESFLLHADEVIQLGTAFGGRGVNSLAVSDLDQDGSAELLFTYSFGTGIHQSRIGMYAPALDAHNIIDADHGYLGDLVLAKDKPTHVSVHVIELNAAEQETNQIATLGKLALSQNSGRPVLALEIEPGLPEEIEKNLILVAAPADNTAVPAQETTAANTEPPAAPTAAETDTAAPTAAASQQTYPITFKPGGTSAYFQKSITAGEIHAYTLDAAGGQTLIVGAVSENQAVFLDIKGLETGEQLLLASDRQTDWSGVLPAAQTYRITLSSGNPETTYFLAVEVPVNIIFKPNENEVRVEGQIDVHTEWYPNLITRVRYLVHASPGRDITMIHLSSPAISELTLGITGQTDGQPYKRYEVSGVEFAGALSMLQGYYIDVYSLGISTDFRLEIRAE